MAIPGDRPGLIFKVSGDGAQRGAGLLPSAHPMPCDRQAWECPFRGFDHVRICRFQIAVRVLP